MRDVTRFAGMLDDGVESRSDKDILLGTYANKIREINENGTEGDYTWEGLLASFLNDMEDLKGN